jgi:hypothetical protein
MRRDRAFFPEDRTASATPTATLNSLAARDARLTTSTVQTSMARELDPLHFAASGERVSHLALESQVEQWKELQPN